MKKAKLNPWANFKLEPWPEMKTPPHWPGIDEIINSNNNIEENENRHR